MDGKTTLLTYIARQLSTGPAPAALLAEEVPHVVGSALKVSVQVTEQLPCTTTCWYVVGKCLISAAMMSKPSALQSLPNLNQRP